MSEPGTVPTASATTDSGGGDVIGDVVHVLEAMPMRDPTEVWGLTITAVEPTGVADPVPTVFAGRWCHTPPAAEECDGGVALRLTAGDHCTCVDALLAHHGSWRPVGTWQSAGQDWPTGVAEVVATVMGLSAELSLVFKQTRSPSGMRKDLWDDVATAMANVMRLCIDPLLASPSDSPVASPSDSPASDRPAGVAPSTVREQLNRIVRQRRRRGGEVFRLIQAGLLEVGQELVWPHRNGPIHTATVTREGYLRLPDGTQWATPSGAVTRVHRANISGWQAWRTVDGVTLYELRAILRLQPTTLQ